MIKKIPFTLDYFITDFGNIIRNGKILAEMDNGFGYKKVNIKIKGKLVQKYVHRLVLETFLGSIPENKQVNHKDGNKANNVLSNLEIVSAKENTRHAIRTGLRARNIMHLFDWEVLKIKELYSEGKSTSTIAERFSRSIRCIQHIVSGQRRTKMAACIYYTAKDTWTVEPRIGKRKRKVLGRFKTKDEAELCYRKYVQQRYSEL